MTTLTHPSAKAPDHWRRKPRTADIRMALELLRSHWNSRTPGGSNHGIRASKKNIVTGVVLHISLHSKNLMSFYSFYLTDWCLTFNHPQGGKYRINSYARAVQLACCCRLDHKILFMALGTIHAIAIKAPNKLNSKSVTVATATPTDTTARAKTCTSMITYKESHEGRAK